MKRNLLIIVSPAALVLGATYVSAQTSGGSTGGTSVGSRSSGTTSTRSPGSSGPSRSSTSSPSSPSVFQGTPSGSGQSPGMFRPPSTGTDTGTSSTTPATGTATGGTVGGATTSGSGNSPGASSVQTPGTSTGTSQDRPGQATSDPNKLHPLQQAKPPDPTSDSTAATEENQFRGSGGVPQQNGSVPGGSIVALTVEERRKIRDIILSENVAQEARANFKLQVGGKVPENVSLSPMPPKVVDIEPRYRDFGFVIVDDRIVVIQRSTREIDTMIPL